MSIQQNYAISKGRIVARISHYTPVSIHDLGLEDYEIEDQKRQADRIEIFGDFHSGYSLFLDGRLFKAAIKDHPERHALRLQIQIEKKTEEIARETDAAFSNRIIAQHAERRRYKREDAPLHGECRVYDAAGNLIRTLPPNSSNPQKISWEKAQHLLRWRRVLKEMRAAE